MVSRASVSTNARLLERNGTINRIGRPGDRRDFYELSPSTWTSYIQTMDRSLTEIRALVARGLGRIDPANQTAHARLGEAREFCDFMLAEHNGLLERWHALRKERTDSHNGLAADKKASARAASPQRS